MTPPPPERRPGPQTCRTETVEVDGVNVVALVRGGEPFDDTDRAAFADIYRAARRRQRQRTTLVPLPTRHSLGLALREHITTRVIRLAAARALHEFLTGEAWVIADPTPVLGVGDEVPVQVAPGVPRRTGVLRVDDDGNPWVEVLPVRLTAADLDAEIAALERELREARDGR